MKFISFHIQNFQAHKDTLITFEKGLNIIVGQTDSGKSSILRALKKLIRDVPKGKPFMSRWAQETKLTLIFEVDKKSYTIIRHITPSKNLYYLNDQKFGGFGNSIPKEIQTILDMQLISLETGDILDLYFTDQHDMPFMVTKGSAGLRSKLLGKIAGMHILDKAIMDVNKDVRALNADLKYKTKEINDLEYELNDFPDLWYDMQLIDSLEEQINSVKQKIITLNSLNTIHTNLQNTIKEAVKIKDILAQLPTISPVVLKELNIKTLKMIDLHKLSDKLTLLNKKIDTLKYPPFVEINTNFTGIKKQVKVLNDLKIIYETLLNTQEKIKSLDIGKEDIQLKKYKAEYDKILIDLKICPICKQSTRRGFYGKQE